ncbi:MAG: hypothetical protein FWE03_06920 [Firmicutes bacterium]|nr:hypothetical protein [Bacillota bacterium]
MDPLELLDELESELKEVRGMHKRENSQIFDILARAKEGVAFNLEEADYIVKKQKQILKNADIVAKNTLKAAEERIEHMLGTTEVMQKADAEAKNLMNKTANKCDALVKKTKEHLDSMFIEAEQFLLSNLSMIRINREELREAMLIKIKETT